MSRDLESKPASLVVQYNVAVKEGQTVVIAGSTEAIPSINELYRETLRAGGQIFADGELIHENGKFLID